MLVGGDLVRKINDDKFFGGRVFVVMRKIYSINGPAYWCVVRQPGDGLMAMQITESNTEVVGKVIEEEFNYYKEKMKPKEVKSLLCCLNKKDYEESKYGV